MVNVSLTLEPIDTPDAEMRVRAAWRILAEMVLDAIIQESVEEGAAQVGAERILEAAPLN